MDVGKETYRFLKESLLKPAPVSEDAFVRSEEDRGEAIRMLFKACDTKVTHLAHWASQPYRQYVHPLVATMNDCIEYIRPAADIETEPSEASSEIDEDDERLIDRFEGEMSGSPQPLTSSLTDC